MYCKRSHGQHGNVSLVSDKESETMKDTLTPNNLFATPQSIEDLASWLDSFKGEEKMIALTAASMAWNLASKLVNEQT